MSQAPSSPNSWLSLGSACRLLEVNPSTLRHWADSGAVRVYRTPGGHRRFSRRDLDALMGQRTMDLQRARPQGWSQSALRRIRRRLDHERLEGAPWHDALDPVSIEQMRLFGRRLLSLASEDLSSSRRRSLVLEEALAIGRLYGEAIARVNLSLSEAVETFVFFRDTLLSSTPGEGPRQRPLLSLMDQVMRGIVSVYDRLPQWAARSESA